MKTAIATLPFFACWALLVTNAVGHDLQSGTDKSIPKDATVNLVLPAQAVIGDHIPFEVVVKNAGKNAFEILTEAELKVQVKDEKGHSLPDLSRIDSTSGTFVSAPPIIKPGETKSFPYSLERYAAIITPGAYTVIIQSSFGWKMDDAKARTLTTAKIQFERPTAEFAAARVHTLCRDMSGQTLATSGGEFMEIWFGLEHLWDPAYLPSLRAEAAAGHVRACLGMSSIIAEEANEVLIELANAAEPNIAMTSALALIMRLPSFTDPAEAFGRGRPEGDPPKALLKTWQAKFDRPLLKVAERFLVGEHNAQVEKVDSDPVLQVFFPMEDRNFASLGANLVAARGGPAQIGTLLAATEKALDIPVAPRTGMRAAASDVPRPLYSLIASIDALRRRGWLIGGPSDIVNVPILGGKAGLLAFFRQLADRSIPRPVDDSWRDLVRAHLNDASPVIRENAVNAIPLPLPDDWEPQVRAALKDPDGSVVIAASKVAAESGHRSFVGPLAQVLESVHDSFPGYIRLTATTAAESLGGGIELWEAWCSLIPDAECGSEAIVRLSLGTIDLPRDAGYSTGGDSSKEQQVLIRDAWRAFLKQNRKVLESGKRVPRDDPSITPILTGLEFSKSPIISIHLKDGTEWPVAQP